MTAFPRFQRQDGAGSYALHLTLPERRSVALVVVEGVPGCSEEPGMRLRPHDCLPHLGLGWPDGAGRPRWRVLLEEGAGRCLEALVDCEASS